MANIIATKNGKTAQFSERVWQSGQPQRNGWRSDMDELPVKKLPAEILEFAEIRKKVKNEQVIPVAETIEEKPAPKPRAKRKKK